MNYRLIRNVRPKGRFIDIGVPLLLIGILLFFHFFYPRLLGEVASRVALPFWKGERFLSEKAGNLFFFFSSKQSLEEDNARLSEDLRQATSLLADREVLLEENRLLRAQLGRTEAAAPRLVAAVLATPPSSPYDTVIIDVGEDHGVQVGGRALHGSIVLGVVSKTYRKSSVVELFSTAGRKTPVSILHEGTSISVESAGKGGGEFTATLPKEVSLAVGDRVVMPGLNPYLFATVERLESSDTDSFQTVRFKNPVPLSSLRMLEIERSAEEQL